jgi:hypothetical protein
VPGWVETCGGWHGLGWCGRVWRVRGRVKLIFLFEYSRSKANIHLIRHRFTSFRFIANSRKKRIWDTLMRGCRGHDLRGTGVAGLGVSSVGVAGVGRHAWTWPAWEWLAYNGSHDWHGPGVHELCCFVIVGMRIAGCCGHCWHGQCQEWRPSAWLMASVWLADKNLAGKDVIGLSVAGGWYGHSCRGQDWRKYDWRGRGWRGHGASVTDVGRPAWAWLRWCGKCGRNQCEFGDGFCTFGHT